MGTGPRSRDERDGEEEPEAGGEGWDDVVLDENFVRGAEVSEPTARTRMLTERWKNDAPAPQPWRSDEPPAGWIFSSSRRRQRAQRPRKRRWFRRRNKGDEQE